MRKQRPDLAHHLVFCGGDWIGADIIRQAVDALNLNDYVHFTGFVPAEMLKYLYSGADLFAFPSLFEGFGIPAIEAMAAGTPIVAAKRASLPEIIGDAGWLFEPTDHSSISDALEKGLFDRDFRESSARRGPLRASAFSWRKSADETVDVLKQLVPDRT